MYVYWNLKWIIGIIILCMFWNHLCYSHYHYMNSIVKWVTQDNLHSIMTNNNYCHGIISPVCYYDWVKKFLTCNQQRFLGILNEIVMYVYVHSSVTTRKCTENYFWKTSAVLGWFNVTITIQIWSVFCNAKNNISRPSYG
jgi:hypothetical protein